MTAFLTILLGYLIGSFPTGVFISRRKYGLDVREVGSGNIGATNIQRVFGWYAGVLVFLIDFAKGAIPLWFVQRVTPDSPWLVALLGISLVVGHCYSLFLGFKGGKGVSTSLGCIFSTVPLCAVISGLVYLLFLKVTKISAIGSLAGILACALFLLLKPPSIPFIGMILALCAIVLIRHRENITRLKKTYFNKNERL